MTLKQIRQMILQMVYYVLLLRSEKQKALQTYTSLDFYHDFRETHLRNKMKKVMNLSEKNVYQFQHHR